MDKLQKIGWPEDVKASSLPTTLPVSLSELKDDLRLEQDDTEQDSLLSRLILAASAAVANIAKHTFITASYKAYYNCFANIMYLPYPPVVSVESIEYLDAAGDWQAVSASAYRAETDATPAKIILKTGASWPTTSNTEANNIRINFTAGYGATEASIPNVIKQAIIALAIDLYEHPEASAEVRLTQNKTVLFLIDTFKLPTFTV